VKAPQLHARDFPGTVSVETLKGNVSLDIAAVQYDDGKAPRLGYETLVPRGTATEDSAGEG